MIQRIFQTSLPIWERKSIGPAVFSAFLTSSILSWKWSLPLDQTYPDTFGAWKQWIHWHPNNRYYPYRLRRRIDERFQRIQMLHWKVKPNAIEDVSHRASAGLPISKCMSVKMRVRTYPRLFVRVNQVCFSIEGWAYLAESSRLWFRSTGFGFLASAATRMIIGCDQILDTYVFTVISNRFQVLIHRIDQCGIRYTNANLSSVQCLQCFVW